MDGNSSSSMMSRYINVITTFHAIRSVLLEIVPYVDHFILNMYEFQCQCELPESYEAYRKQQHRWHSGPMQLFRLCLPDIIRSKVLTYQIFSSHIGQFF